MYDTGLRKELIVVPSSSWRAGSPSASTRPRSTFLNPPPLGTGMSDIPVISAASTTSPLWLKVTKLSALARAPKIQTPQLVEDLLIGERRVVAEPGAAHVVLGRVDRLPVAKLQVRGHGAFFSRYL